MTPEDLLSKELRRELHTRLGQRQPLSDGGDDFAARGFRSASVRHVLREMLLEREEQLRHALDSTADLGIEGPIEATPLLIALLTLPAELALLRSALNP